MTYSYIYIILFVHSHSSLSLLHFHWSLPLSQTGPLWVLYNMHICMSTYVCIYLVKSKFHIWEKTCNIYLLSLAYFTQHNMASDSILFPANDFLQIPVVSSLWLRKTPWGYICHILLFNLWMCVKADCILAVVIALWWKWKSCATRFLGNVPKVR